MAHFAEIGTDNVILRVISVANDVLLDENGDEQESLGETFCRDLLGGTWKQTSYNKTFTSGGLGFPIKRKSLFVIIEVFVILFFGIDI